MRVRVITLKGPHPRRRRPGFSGIGKLAVLGVGSLNMQGRLPTSSASQITQIPPGALTLQPTQPTSSVSQITPIPRGALQLTGRQPATSVGFAAAIPPGALKITPIALTTKTFRRRRTVVSLIRAHDLLDFDFAGGKFILAGQQPASPTTLGGWSFARASVATMVDSHGLVTKAAAAAARIANTGLWLERAATNLLKQSEDMRTSWARGGNGTGTAPTATLDVTQLAPDGVTNPIAFHFDKGAGATTSDWSILDQSGIATTVGQPYTYTAWFKAAAPTAILCRHVAGAGYTAINIGTSWARASVIETAIAASSELDLTLRGGYTTQQTADFWMWGADMKLEAYPSSYVPTTAAAAARAADNAAIAVGVPTVFTLFVDADLDNLDGVARYLAAWDDGTSQNYITFIRYSDNAAYIQAIQGGAVRFNRSVAGKAGARRLKMAVSYDGATWRGAVDGVAVATTTAAKPTVTTLRLGQIYTGGGGYLDGRLRRARVMLQALGNSDLQALTT